MSRVVHSDEYNALSSSLDALEEFMVKLSQQHADLARRLTKLEEAA